MKLVAVTMSVVVLTLGLLASFASAKSKRSEPVSHSGTFVSAAAGKLVMTGRNGKEHSHAMAKDAKIMVDGKAGTLEGLKKGMHITVTTSASGNVTAVSTAAATPFKLAPVKPVVAKKVTPATTAPAKPAVPATPSKTAK